jgi:hypothetical protein
MKIKVIKAGSFTRDPTTGKVRVDSWEYRGFNCENKKPTNQQLLAATLIHMASENGISLIEAGAVDREVKMTLESEREALNILERVKKT